MADQPESQQAALRRVRHLGSARSGVRDDWAMRLTSAALAPLTVAFVWLMLTLAPKDYNAARAELGSPLPAIIVLLFVLAGVWHMQLGMRSIILDYVAGRAREWALIANQLFCAALGMVCFYAVLRIGFV